MTAPRGLAPVRTVLTNGVRLLVQPSRVTPAVTVSLSIEAGSVNDPAGLAGVAHFLSKVIDRGAGSLTAEEIADEFDRRGASLAVSVNRHALTLLVTCLAEDFAPVLRLLGEIVMRPALPEAEVALRRGEVLTLLRQDQDSPATVALERVLAELYGADHAYGRPSRGTADSVERIDRAALAAFHETHVGPSATTLAVVGDVDPSFARDAVADVFGAWTASVASAPALIAAAPSSARRTVVVPMPHKAQADISYGFITIARNDPAFMAAWVMNNILGQYAMGGRLGENIRERQGMAYYAMTQFDPGVLPSPLIVRAGVDPVNVEKTVASIDAEIASFLADGPTGQEFTESLQYLVGALPRQLETYAAIAKFLQTIEFFGLGLDYDRRLPGLLRAVTRDDVVASARALLDPARATVVVAGPYSGSLA
jgi:zinc protease